MSLATRRRASARWRRWATSSARWRAADDGPDRVRGDPGDARSRGPSEPGGLADDEQHAPRRRAAGDRHGQLGAVVGQDRQRVVVRRRRAGRRASAPRRSGRDRRPARGSGRGSRSGRAGRRAAGDPALGAGDRPRREAVAAGLPDRDEVMAVRVADRVDRGVEAVVGVVVGIDQAGSASRRRRGRGVALGVERVGRPAAGRARRGGEPGGRGGSTLRRPPHGRLAAGARRRPRRSRRRRGSAGGRPAGSAGRRAG